MEAARSSPRPFLRRLAAYRAAGPLLVSATYYLGAQVGFALQSPNAPQSVLWLPNSILLGVLLSVPYRRWPAYLAAAFPAQMLVSAGAGAPPLTLALLFLTNCADASLGAFLVRRVTKSHQPFAFDSLAATLAFVAFGATLPTVLFSFADAGISVATGWSPSYLDAFVTRARSNVLTHLIVVPAIVDLMTCDRRCVRGARVAEAAVLTGLLLVTCGIAFSRPAGSLAFAAVLYAPLPLLLWAAFRFGPGGIGWGALLVSIVASWHVLHGRGPFSSRSPLQEVVSMQLFLLASTLPLLCLSAAIRERNRASLALRERESALRTSYGRVRELAGKLIAAQETERSRIAREMHDDFNQQLAGLSISMSAMRRRTLETPELDDDFRILQERTIALIQQVRDFSHDLHPGTLDHLALVPTLRTHCADFAGQHGLDIGFHAPQLRAPLPREAAVCLFRILQEGLRNIASHAGVREASVSLSQTPDCIELTIADRGRGFDPDGGAARRGLGLLSMEERARLVGGTFTITSAYGKGTTLLVQVPATGAH